MSSEHNCRVAALRARFAVHGVAGFIVPRADEHLGEYVPENAERLAWLTGFTGSAGLAIVLETRAAVFSDGRYTLQLAQQTDERLFERRHITLEKPEDWLRAAAPGARIGYDPRLVSAEGLKRFTGVELVALPNLVDEIWVSRPAAPASAVVAHELAFAGEAAAAKRARLGAELKAAGQDAALLTDPTSLCWLLNIRGADVEFCPVVLAFVVLHADGGADLIIDPARVSVAARDHLGPDVRLVPPADLPALLAGLHGQSVRFDPASQPVWFETALRAAGALIAPGPDITALPRACKNAVEQAGARAAHERDGVAMVRFLAWFSAHGVGQTERSVAAKLLEFRAQGARFRGESFAAISGAGENGAIIHYRVTDESNRAIKPDEAYLIDSGGQYLDATTDITRTLWTGPGAPPEVLKAHFTRVLAGHIALAAIIFPPGVAGAHLDVLARASLWAAGLDYDHGTGHGVGSYLSVHEGPAGISRAARPVALQPGMILSNEPGYYLPGAYGIRLENLLLVREASLPGAAQPFLGFETLTQVPFARELIAPGLLTPEARAWLNAYHAGVLGRLGPHLDEPTRGWLRAACAPI
ncbi:aminopeptidase P family protein [Acidocella sp.]|uniref:aminopeptidase P family protein n=1 Tax=Acidocella sp. TaxID=50710 RepID=UPI00262BECA4|nr:aminopeptidase P family protein [Acidocella sp.]